MSTIKCTCAAHGREASACDDCYAAEQTEFARADAYSAYVNTQTREITTFPGRKLATLTNTQHGPWRYTPTGGVYKMRYVQAIAPDGSHWHGAGSDEWDLVTLRRSHAR